MAFEDGVQYLEEYNKKKYEALNNEKPKRWFPTDAGDMSALFQKFESGGENSDWIQGWRRGDNFEKQQGRGLKIAFLAGCRRDTHTIFGHIGSGMNLRLSSLRLEYQRSNFRSLRLKTL